MLHSVQLLWRFVRATMNINEGTDREGTIEGIKRDVDFKGINVWILIFSIFIASIGLNVNSTAVVIGAMLISPLMGPILGLGLAIGINDWKLLVRSGRSLLVATVIAITTSAIYFKITPLSDASEELIGRTAPTFLDVFVAIFGGLAGIIAGSRREKSNVIPGVAIATALMPPLCTAGYGLATWQWDFFGGAFYLFILNCVFIALSTFVVVRYLQFPLKEFVNQRRERLVKALILSIVILVIIPSGLILYNVVREEIFMRNASRFVADEIHPANADVLNHTIHYRIDDTDSCRIDIALMGDFVSRAERKVWENKMAEYDLTMCRLKVTQNKDMNQLLMERDEKMQGALKQKFVEELLYGTQEDLEEKERQIRALIRKVDTYQRDSVPYNQVRSEMLAQYPEIEGLLYGKAVVFDAMGAADTIATLQIKWPKTIDRELRIKHNERLAKFLQVRWHLDSVAVLPYPN